MLIPTAGARWGSGDTQQLEMEMEMEMEMETI